MSTASGSVYRAFLRGPASTGSKPTSRIRVAAMSLPACVLPQYTMLGGVALPRASNTPKSTSLGMLLKAETTSAPGTFFVDLGGVEESDSAFHGRANDGDRLLLVGTRAVGETHVHATEPDGRNLQVAISKFSFLHVDVLSLGLG